MWMMCFVIKNQHPEFSVDQIKHAADLAMVTLAEETLGRGCWDNQEEFNDYLFSQVKRLFVMEVCKITDMDEFNDLKYIHLV